MNIKLIVGLLLITVVIILSGCVDSAPAKPIREVSKTVHEIKSEKLFDYDYDNYKVIHDDELNQTCTIFLTYNGAGISCIADSQLNMGK